MKKYILRPLGTALATFGIFAFAACSDVYTGGDVSASGSGVSGSEAAITQGASSYNGSLSYSASVSFDNGSSYSEGSATISKAASDSTVTMKIYSYTRLNEDSVANAFSFWSLSDNTTYNKGAPVRSTQLASSVNDYSVSLSSSTSATSKNVTTTVEFTVNTSSVTTSKIAVLVDATKLKDLSGNAVLNNDSNEKAGEETDNLVYYISVSEKADGSTTTALNHYTYYTEKFASTSVSGWSIPSSLSEVEDSDGNPTGAYQAKVSASYYDYTSGSIESKYAENLASYYNAIYSVQYRENSSGAWKTDSAFSFAYDGTEKLADGTSNPTYRYYVATTSKYAYGTQFRLVTKTPKKSDSYSETANSTILYGHPAYASYRNSSFTKYGDVETVDSLVYTASPEYILSVSSAFAAGAYEADDFADAQSAIVDVDEEFTGVYSISLGTDDTADDNQLEFGSTDGFLVTDPNGNKLDFTLTSIDSSTVLISLKNKNCTDAVFIWAGEGTTLKKNYTNASQVKFGTPKVGNGKATDGYARIAIKNVVEVGSASSSDIGDYTVTYVSWSDDTVQYFPVYLEKGKTYKVEIASGYSTTSTPSPATITDGSKNYRVRMYNAEKSLPSYGGYYLNYYSYSDNPTGFTYAPSSEGIYYIGVSPYYTGSSSYGSGYVGFHIYEN